MQQVFHKTNSSFVQIQTHEMLRLGAQANSCGGRGNKC